MNNWNIEGQHSADNNIIPSAKSFFIDALQDKANNAFNIEALMETTFISTTHGSMLIATNREYIIKLHQAPNRQIWILGSGNG